MYVCVFVHAFIYGCTFWAQNGNGALEPRELLVVGNGKAGRGAVSGDCQKVRTFCVCVEVCGEGA